MQLLLFVVDETFGVAANIMQSLTVGRLFGFTCRYLETLEDAVDFIAELLAQTLLVGHGHEAHLRPAALEVFDDAEVLLAVVTEDMRL